MLIIDFNSILCLVIFAHVIESKVYVLRDYEDDPDYINNEDRVVHEDTGLSHKPFSGPSSFKPKKKRHNRQAVLHYGRHIYHLDSFDDLTKLRSKLGPDYVSYDYFDINNLIRSGDATRNIPWDYVHDLLILSPSVQHIECKGKNCKGNSRKHNDVLKKIKKQNQRTSVDPVLNYWKKKKQPIGKLKRFRIIDNRHKHKTSKREPKKKYDSSEEYQHKRKNKLFYNKKKIYASESKSASSSSESKETSSESRERWEATKKKLYDSGSKSVEESSSEEITTRKPKNIYDSHSESNSWEDKREKHINSDSKSIDDSKKRKSIYGSDETKRKTGDKDMFLQGNKLYKVDDELDQRRRLPQFLPKRFHWDPSEIHDLGYYWFNGPKGRYPSPTSLL